jgi:hypothetical protein
MLTFTGTVADKTYDATTAATLSGYTLTGFVGDQTVAASAGAADFSDPNAGTGKTVTISAITLANGTNGGLASNYTVSPTATSTGTINPAVLTVDATVANKVYDGTTAATMQSYGLSGLVGNQTVTGVGGTAVFADKNVGDDKPVTISGITLVNGTNGGLASNYVVSPNASSNADITPATLQVAGVVALNTVYNGTTAADVDTQAAVLTGVVAGDNVSVGSITGNYLTKNVGTNLPIVTSAFVLTGSDASNYTLVQPTGLTASITPRPLTVTASGESKVYDGTTAATVVLADNAVAGDALTVTSTSNFLDPNAGTNKYIAVTNIAISGADAEDYTVNGSTAAYANISPATLTVTATGVNRTYNATTNATVTLTDNLAPGDQLSLTYTDAAFDNKNVGNGKTIVVDGIEVSGADAANYTVNTTATTTANITPATLTVAALGKSKPFDGTTAATVILTDDAFAGDQVTLTDTSAAFAGAAVGNDKTITVDGIRIGGADGGNYVLTSTTATTSGNITSASASTTGQNADGTWSLPPAPPQPSTPAVTSPPPAVLDLALPLGFGEGQGMSGAAGTVGATAEAANVTNGVGDSLDADTSGLVTVSLVRPATAQLPGLVSVSVPEAIVSSGKGFSFPLPTVLAEAAAAGGEVRVTRMNGRRLPSWLRYVPETKTFVSTALPAGALPLEVLVRIGTERWTVRIAARASR